MFTLTTSLQFPAWVAQPPVPPLPSHQQLLLQLCPASLHSSPALLPANFIT